MGVLPMGKDCRSLYLSFDMGTQILCFPCSIHLHTTQPQNPDFTVAGTSQSFLNDECVNECTGELDECLLQSEVVKIGISFIQISSTFPSFI